jgi:polysaccharide deacetylase family protein (PEP-CTERM system associated)
MKTGAPQVRNVMTIDVEDYFQVSAFAPYIARADWAACECRVERNVSIIVQLLADRQIKATFFTLGWIAKRYPQLIRKIVSEGHEIASHGFGHGRVSDQTPAFFSEDVSHAKLLLEDISGLAVIGYRAPSFSIGAGNLWAFEELQNAGYRYSSSIYPIRHDHYGMVDAPRSAFEARDGFIEFPLSTCRLFKKNMPSSGGGYFRLLPYTVSRWMLNAVNSENQQPAIFYFHPWEIDVHQPRIKGIDLKTKFRHYINISRMEHRLKKLFSDFSWGRMDQFYFDKLRADGKV